MTDRAEIERLLNMTGRTLEGLPETYSSEEREKNWYAIVGNKAFGDVVIHQSDVIELLVGALRDALDKQPKWISVEDRLPDEHEGIVLVLVNGVAGKVKLVSAYELAEYNAKYGKWIPWDYAEIEAMEVLYWLSIPEQMKEG